MSSQQHVRVGFDLDGVLLYNPFRVARPVVSFAKRILIGQKKTKFYVPQSTTGQSLWRILHTSSIWIEPGFKNAKKLINNKKIEGYIITARYGFLQEDFDKWHEKLEAKKYFKKCYVNKKNKQPHVYKNELVQKLDLDYFIEDNWDIVRALSQDPQNTNRKILWIYNAVDHLFISYPYAFPSLKKALEWLENDIKQR